MLMALVSTFREIDLVPYGGPAIRRGHRRRTTAPAKANPNDRRASDAERSTFPASQFGESDHRADVSLRDRLLPPRRREHERCWIRSRHDHRLCCVSRFQCRAAGHKHFRLFCRQQSGPVGGRRRHGERRIDGQAVAGGMVVVLRDVYVLGWNRPCKRGQRAPHHGTGNPIDSQIHVSLTSRMAQRGQVLWHGRARR